MALVHSGYNVLVAKLTKRFTCCDLCTTLLW